MNAPKLVPVAILLGLLSHVVWADEHAASSPSSRRSGPPNIVLIISDDQAWTDYGFMGHRVIETPHLDRLAAQSVLFRRGYVPTACAGRH